MRMLDLFCGRFGWSKAFAARGWECTGIDLVQPPEIPGGSSFFQWNVLQLDSGYLRGFDFICASSPCEQFSCFSMKMFQPNPPYPALGIELFNHTRQICEAAGVPYVMENVRGAVQFVGKPSGRCGPFCLWGNAVPPILPQGNYQVEVVHSARKARQYLRRSAQGKEGAESRSCHNSTGVGQLRG